MKRDLRLSPLGIAPVFFLTACAETATPSWTPPGDADVDGAAQRDPGGGIDAAASDGGTNADSSSLAEAAAAADSALAQDASEGAATMIADLVAQGITGVKGYTDEPLLQSVASPTIAMDRYLRGFTLAESLYAASHFVGWTDVVLGDPLTRPYPPQAVGSEP